MKLSTEDPVAHISAGDNHSAILTRKGEMLTFGLNSSGQLGHGDSNNTSVPKPVEEFKGSVVTQIACGNNNTVAFVPGCGQVFTFGNCEHGQLGLGKLVEKVQTPEIVNGSWSSKHEEATVSVFRICSAGNQTYILTSNIPDSSPSDFRAIGDEVGVVKFEKVFCSTLENVEDETDIISVINSKSCWNSSFADLNQVTNHYHHGVHLDQASEVLKLMCGCKFSETIMKYLFEMLRSLDTDPPDLDAIRLYITLPMVFEHMEDSVQKLEMIRFFFIKLSHMEKVVWKVLERWHKSSEVAFVNIVHLGKALMLDNLGYLFLTGGDAGLRCQNVMKILNSHNEISKITSYKAFHLSLTEQFIKSNLEVVRILLLKYPFLGDAKSKATLLLLDAKNRKNKANFQERIDIMFGQFLPFLGLPPKIRISVNRSSLVADSVQQLQNVENLSRPFYVQFQGEEGIDDGAINKEYFMLIMPELLTNYELFSENDDSNYLWFSTSYIDAKEPLYNLVGKLCGIALCNNTVVNANFPLVLYKKLLGQEPDLDDFKEFEPTFGNSLQQILDFEEQEDQTVEEVFELTFVSSKGVPLKPNGHEIPVTSVNRDEYVRLCVNYVVNKSVEKQFSSFQNGFSKACSGEIFDIFRPEELMEMVVGKQDFSWEEVKASMDAFSVSDEFSEVCEWFWEVLLSFNDEEKEQFLIFLTASNKVPVSGFKFEIQQIEANDKLLPIAMTCYNILQLPVYSSKVVLEDRLNLAIQCKGFHLKMIDNMLTCGKGALVDSLGRKQDVTSLEKLSIAGDCIKNVALTGDNAYILYHDGTIRAYVAEKDTHADNELLNVIKDIKILNIHAGVHGQVFVIDENGIAYAWGCNDHGQLGLTDADDFVSLPMSVPFTNKKKVVQVACGNTHTLILLKNGDLFSMGDNEYGQLGLKNKCPVNEPERITTLENVPILRIAAGGWHSFCLSLSGILYSWGRNNFGQLGVGDFMDHSSPLIIKMSSKLPIAYVSAGDYHSALLTRDGQMFSFGLGAFGQLGHGVPCNNESKPKQVEEFSGSVVTQIACGQNHTVAFSPDCKQVFAFGSCSDGQLGIGIKKDKIPDPMMVNIPQSSDENGNNKVKQVFAGGIQTVVLLEKSVGADILQQQDFRILDSDQHILTLDENYCKIISKLPRNSEMPADIEQKLISIISSQKCLTGSFHLEVVRNEVVSRSFDFDKVETLLSQIFESKNEAVEKLIVKVLCDNVLSRRPKDDPDTESLKYFLLMPFLISPIKCVVSRAKCFFLFIRKLVTMKAKYWGELSSWYKTSSSVFSALVKLCCIHIADGLLKKFEVSSDAVQNELNLVKKLHKLNCKHHIISFDEFYLSVKFSLEFLNEQMRQKKQNKTPLIFSCPFLFNIGVKKDLLSCDLSHALPFYIFPVYSELIVNRENVFEDAIKQLDFIKDPALKLYIVFEGEEGMDYDGLTKEFFRLVFQEICQPSSGLFIEDEKSRMMWFTNNTDETKYYYVGMLCGLALYNTAIMDYPLASMMFPLALYKKLQGVEINLDDFKQIFPSFGNSLQKLIDSEEIVQDKHKYHFVSNSGEPLKKRGQHLAVTNSNKNEYVKLQVDYVLNKSIKKQFDSFKKGFEKVCTSPVMKLFRPEELMRVSAYKKKLNWKKLQKNAVIHPLSDTFKQVCDWFWEIVHHMTEEDKAKLLIFLTGTDIVPLEGIKDKLKIYEVFDDEGNLNDALLPVVQTCFLTLELTLYSSKEVLEERLRVAMNCKTFGIL
uniref:probable E3 ubiquitin-protein ligase HERC3 n=1 Tax=Styela clava TaxID=7725 RepID=UPI00193ABFE6|nr:probable E3 ubiquitin-protein ligase HERC3 [Styela clava]